MTPRVQWGRQFWKLKLRMELKVCGGICGRISLLGQDEGKESELKGACPCLELHLYGVLGSCRERA